MYLLLVSNCSFSFFFLLTSSFLNRYILLCLNPSIYSLFGRISPFMYASLCSHISHSIQIYFNVFTFVSICPYLCISKFSRLSQLIHSEQSVVILAVLSVRPFEGGLAGWHACLCTFICISHGL